MRFGILGPLDVRTDDGTPVDPGGPRPRALLTLLLLDAAEALASVADSAERAAVLLGAGTGLRAVRSGGDPDAVRVEEEVRAKLSPEAYDEAFQQGLRQGSAAVSER
ncbi:hypothetical protein ACFV2H_21545 [Streptomyces sp. NPDC059629]|uniref:hypothetical protein n=1 Tax=Streptomyces sp. NPDC059629 TaxID=3346889 RepID=UPI0036A33295